MQHDWLGTDKSPCMHRGEHINDDTADVNEVLLGLGSRRKSHYEQPLCALRPLCMCP